MFSKNKNEVENIGSLYGDVFIPRRFENIILRHVILNSLRLDSYKPAPLLLLQGKKGEGKTFMTETVLKGNNIHYRIISSSILAGSNENDAVTKLMLYYNKCEMNPQIGKYTALVIDDFHLSIAITKSEANHTTNADNLLSALMNIADNKNELKAPIILIGNNFANAYAPLTRLGRMSIEKWEPSIFDKVEMLKRIIMKHKYSGNCISSNILYRFIEDTRNQYIGFYEKVIEEIVLQDFMQVTEFFASKGGCVNYEQLLYVVHNSTKNKVVTIDNMYNKAEELLSKKLEKLDE